MNILAIETSSEYLSVALANEQDIVSQECKAGQQHSELLLPMIEKLLQQSGTHRDQLSAIAFGAGPGSFTGLRIACGVAQGMALGLGISVIPISTLEAIVEAVGQEKVVVAIDARMGEIYFAAYINNGLELQRVVDECLCNPNNIFDLPGDNWYGAGSGFALYRDQLVSGYTSKFQGITEHLFPHARDVAKLAINRFQKGDVLSPELALPTYIRNKVALTTRERSAA